MKEQSLKKPSHLEKLSRPKLKMLYKALFFLTVGTALVSYIQSSFLEGIVAEKYVGLIFSLGAAVTLAAVFLFVPFVKKIGKNSAMIMILCLYIVSLCAMIFGSPLIKIAAFVLYSVISTLIWINFDIFIESFSADAMTGRIRGIALTVTNVAWVASPAIAGFLAEKSGFPIIFLISAVIIFPFIWIFKAKFKDDNRDGFNHTPHFWHIFKDIFASKPLSKIFAISFILSFFYAWMVIYVPLYLLSLGFGWGQIGIIFSVMLLPFIILQYLAGWLADKFFGEKEILTVGIVIMAGATVVLFFVHEPVVWVWMALLFATRVGAALIEVMRDSYFYKQIDMRDVHLIAFFRNTSSFAYFVAPLLASLILLFFATQWLFLFLGIFVLGGLFFSLTLPDTK